MPSAPSNATLVQLGFDYGLNYPFVVREQDSASQIFAYLPQGIAYGLGISHDKVTMNSLTWFDTSDSLQYITTMARAYVPAEYVQQLELDLHSPLSSIYSNPDPMIATLMNMVNPTLPILPGAQLNSDGSSSADSNPAATGGPAANQGAPIGGDAGQSQPVRSSSVGIGVGAVCGAAAYAAAMVYVARRYKKKRASHQRASSVPTAGEMSEGGAGMAGFFMSGGRGSSAAGSGMHGSRNSGHSSNGRSVREQGISAPVMSENSLGWN